MFFSGIMPSFLADRVGRRPLLIYSYLGTGICLATVGIYFFLLEVIRVDLNSLTPYGFVTFTGIILSNIISTIGFQSIIVLIQGEIFPLNVKAVAMTSFSILAGLLSFAVARGYQLLKDVLGLCGVFWIFAAVAFSGALFCFIFVPETKGKSLREIQVLLQGDLYEADEDVELKRVVNGVACEAKELEELNKKEDDGK